MAAFWATKLMSIWMPREGLGCSASAAAGGPPESAFWEDFAAAASFFCAPADEEFSGEAALGSVSCLRRSSRTASSRISPSVLNRRRSITLKDSSCFGSRSEEHTSELQSLRHLVC